MIRTASTTHSTTSGQPRTVLLSDKPHEPSANRLLIRLTMFDGKKGPQTGLLPKAAAARQPATWRTASSPTRHRCQRGRPRQPATPRRACCGSFPRGLPSRRPIRCPAEPYGQREIQIDERDVIEAERIRDAEERRYNTARHQGQRGARERNDARMLIGTHARNSRRTMR